MVEFPKNSRRNSWGISGEVPWGFLDGLLEIFPRNFLTNSWGNPGGVPEELSRKSWRCSWRSPGQIFGELLEQSRRKYSWRDIRGSPRRILDVLLDEYLRDSFRYSQRNCWGTPSRGTPGKSLDEFVKKFSRNSWINSQGTPETSNKFRWNSREVLLKEFLRNSLRNSAEFLEKKIQWSFEANPKKSGLISATILEELRGAPGGISDQLLKKDLEELLQKF